MKQEAPTSLSGSSSHPVYCINSDKRLTYSNRSHKLINMCFSGNPTNSVNNFCAQIYEYAKEIEEPVERAAYLYFEEYKKVYSRYPWNELKASNFYFVNNYIKTELHGKRIAELYDGVSEYKCEIKDIEEWTNLPIYNIKNIRINEIVTAIKDNHILSVIDEY